jgi:hypothetical protein
MRAEEEDASVGAESGDDEAKGHQWVGVSGTSAGKSCARAEALRTGRETPGERRESLPLLFRRP